MAPPELAYDLVREILLRIPPDDPALLLRASVVCKPWRRLLTDPAFIRRYRAFHRTPPLLGFFCTSASRGSREDLGFAPTSTFRPRDSNSKHRMLDCRHGRALLFDHATWGLLVWDPITGEDHRIPNHRGMASCHYNAAVVCAAADCDHRGCHGGPFLVVLVATRLPVDDDEEFETNAWVYSSEAGRWSGPTNQEVDGYPCIVARRPPVLTGDTLIFGCEYGAILRYDLRGDRGLSVIPGPGVKIVGDIVLMPAEEDGDLRIAFMVDSNIVLWSLETRGPGGVASWTQCRAIKLHQMLTIVDPMRQIPPHLIGFVKGPVGDVLFMRTGAGVFAVKLHSRRIKKVDDIEFGDGANLVFPYTSFVTP